MPDIGGDTIIDVTGELENSSRSLKRQMRTRQLASAKFVAALKKSPNVATRISTARSTSISTTIKSLLLAKVA